MRQISLLRTAMATLALCAPLAACVDDAALDLGPTTDVDEEPAPGDRETASGERSASVAGFTLTMNAHAIVGTDGTNQTVVLKGTASRTITNVFSYVPDDAFGTAALTGTKTFTITLDEPHEINTLLSGLPILVSIDTLTGQVRHFDAQVTMQPRFARFEGTTRTIVDPVIRPVLVEDAIDDLRYRGRFTTTVDHWSPEVFAFDAGDPEVVLQRSLRETTFDWRFAPFSLAYDPPSDPISMRATFQNYPYVATKHAGIDLKVVRLGLTTDDPYVVWPAPTCTPEVAECYLAQSGGGDLGLCGDYRTVRPCRNADLCELTGGEPVTLTEISTSSLDDEIAAYNAACPNGGTWCQLYEVRAYTVPECTDEPVTTQLLFQLVADQVWTDDTYGDYVDDAGLASSMFFASSPSSAGPALASAVDGLAGSSTAEGWHGSNEYPCHNCHNWYIRTIAWYPATRTVVVLDGVYGWDS